MRKSLMGCVIALSVLACRPMIALGNTDRVDGPAAFGSLPADASLVVALQQPTPPAPADEFVPLRDLPPREEVPAAPLLVAAYVFVWAALMVYVVTLWRRLTKVEQELASVSRQLDQGRRE
jgi:CcmD family protein